MSATTPEYGWPYASGSDAPDGRVVSRDLALAVEADVARIDAVAAAAAGLADAWETYTPVWAAAAGTTTLGDGTLVGLYKEIGSTVFFSLRFQWGNTTTQSSSGSNWNFSLPVTADQTYGSTFWFANAWILDSGAGRHVAHAYLGSTNAGVIVTHGTNNEADDTSPMTWANGDRLNINGFYQKAL